MLYLPVLFLSQVSSGGSTSLVHWLSFNLLKEQIRCLNPSIGQCILDYLTCIGIENNLCMLHVGTFSQSVTFLQYQITVLLVHKRTSKESTSDKRSRESYPEVTPHCPLSI